MNDTIKYARKVKWICMLVIEMIQPVKSEHPNEILSSWEKASAGDVLSMYDAYLSQLDKSKILQISSDGPNVNLAFF